MKVKKDIIWFITTALLWGVIIGLGVIAGESRADCEEPPPEEYDYYIVYTV
jgi:hypothetical protein